MHVHCYLRWTFDGAGQSTIGGVRWVASARWSKTAARGASHHYQPLLETVGGAGDCWAGRAAGTLPLRPFESPDPWEQLRLPPSKMNGWSMTRNDDGHRSSLTIVDGFESWAAHLSSVLT